MVSAFATLWQRDGGTSSREPVDAMLGAMGHHGRRGGSTWQGGSAVLGHLPLHASPEGPRAPQPLARGALAITATGRIDNRAELLSHLKVAAPPADVADADLMLRAYEQWGDGCVDHLVGDYAFAIWDGSRQTLFCARDPIGMERFYYVQTPRFVACASEIRALLALPEVPRRLNEEGVAAALVPGVLDAEVTLVKGVKRLRPGHALTLGPRGMQLRRFWAPDPKREIRLPSNAAYAEALRDLLLDAVRCRLRTSLPLGTMLSGGLDSSSVTCIARDIRGPDADVPLSAVSVLFAHTGVDDERAWIDAVLRGGGLRPVPVNWSGALLSDPAADLTAFTPHLIVNRDAYRGAAEAGLGVLLGGDGGDQALSWGHLAFGGARVLLRAGHWRAGTRELLRRAYHRFRGVKTANGSLAWAEEPLVLNATLAQSLGIAERRAAVAARVRRSSPRALHAQRLENTWASGALEADAALAARHGLEVRSPFWDRRVLEFCLALPLEQKEGRDTPRIVLRRAMEGLLPPEVHSRPGKWVGALALLLPALLQIRGTTDLPPGKEAPLSSLLDTSLVEVLWRSLDRPEVPPETLFRCWLLAELSAQVRTHGLTV